METMNAQLARIERVGGSLCLDFVNTRTSHFDPAAREYLAGYADLLEWLRGCDDGLDARTATRLAAAARAHPRRAATVFARARDLRDLLQRVFAARAEGRTPVPADVDALNREAATALAHRRLEPGAHWHWRWDDDDALERPLWQVLASAVDLLQHGEPARLKQCPAPDGCGWLFHDGSKNQTRRWCSMRMCGNGAKVRRFQQRRRDAGG